MNNRPVQNDSWIGWKSARIGGSTQRRCGVALKNGFLNLLLLKQGMHCPFLSALHLEKNPLLLLVLCSL
jgi:hypothetical protein